MQTSNGSVFFCSWVCRRAERHPNHSCMSYKCVYIQLYTQLFKHIINVFNEQMKYEKIKRSVGTILPSASRKCFHLLANFIFTKWPLSQCFLQPRNPQTQLYVEDNRDWCPVGWSLSPTAIFSSSDECTYYIQGFAALISYFDLCHSLNTKSSWSVKNVHPQKSDTFTYTHLCPLSAPPNLAVCIWLQFMI